MYCFLAFFLSLYAGSLELWYQRQAQSIFPQNLAINSMTDSSSQSLLPQSSTFIRTGWPQGGDRTPHPHLLYLSSAPSLLPRPPLPPSPSSTATKSSALALGLLNSSTLDHRRFLKLPTSRVDPHPHTLPHFPYKHFSVCLCVYSGEEIRWQAQHLYLLVNPFLMISITVSRDAVRQYCKIDEALGVMLKQSGRWARTAGVKMPGFRLGKYLMTVQQCASKTSNCCKTRVKDRTTHYIPCWKDQHRYPHYAG